MYLKQIPSPQSTNDPSENDAEGRIAACMTVETGSEWQEGSPGQQRKDRNSTPHREKPLTSQRIGENRTLPQLGRAQWGVDLALLDLPVMTEHSVLIWRSMRMLGSCPGGMATGVLHRGPILGREG